MTDTELTTEDLAQRIAARGRDALVERLRAAYAEAASVHADVVSLEPARIEALVQRAADHADGLQWRRALAGVGAEELGVSVPDALAHPAVTRAQTLVGAPAYEQSLAELIGPPAPAAPAAPARAADNGAAGASSDADNGAAGASSDADDGAAGASSDADDGAAGAVPDASDGAAGAVSDAGVAEDQLELAPEPEPEQDAAPHAAEPYVPEPVTAMAREPDAAAARSEPPADQLETIEADETVLELLPEPEPVELDTQLYEAVPDHAAEEAPAGDLEGADDPPAAEDPPAADAPPAADPAPDATELRVPAIHLGGVANLPTKREGLGLRLSEAGLDIVGEHEIIGRLLWEEIDSLEVPHLRARRRRQQVRARLVVRTPHGDASFEIPEMSSDELRDRIEPLVARYGRH